VKGHKVKGIPVSVGCRICEVSTAEISGIVQKNERSVGGS
jgi:hypothetical protein